MQHDQDQDINLVEHWLTWDTKRVIAGALAGVLAACVALAFASVLAMVGGREFWYPAKLLGTITMGYHATEYGMHLAPMIAGVVFWALLGSLLGGIYAHFTYSNTLSTLLAMGLVWGIFSWIFIWCLFLQSILPIRYAQVSFAAAFPVCVVFGISLSATAFFDRMVKGR